MKKFLILNQIIYRQKLITKQMNVHQFNFKSVSKLLRILDNKYKQSENQEPRDQDDYDVDLIYDLNLAAKIYKTEAKAHDG